MLDYEFAADGNRWDIVDTRTGLVVAVLRPYGYGRGWIFRMIDCAWGGKDALARVAYPGLVRSKQHAIEVVKVVRRELPPPIRWYAHYFLPEESAGEARC